MVKKKEPTPLWVENYRIMRDMDYDKLIPFLSNVNNGEFVKDLPEDWENHVSYHFPVILGKMRLVNFSVKDSI
jgi:gamma-glutamylcysteine synthetase